MGEDVLDRFSAATGAWFRSSFAAPTAAQRGAWRAISTGQHTLVVAPTGSGKTLAAFLWGLDRLASRPVPDDPARRCRLLYISPLKALGVDVERNLRAPLVGIRHAADRLGLDRPDIRVGVRSGDTPPDERRTFARRPPDILITTPESLFLLLTSAGREALRGVETVILDEIHAVADTKRGAHLAVSLERLDALLESPAQRIGLSATVRPIDEVSRFLAGGRPVTVVAPPADKRWQLDVVVPVPDLAAIGDETGDLSGAAAGDPRRTSVWPHVEERIVDLVASHRSTLVFANSRRLAERLTARLNEIWWERAQTEATPAPVRSDDAPSPSLPTSSDSFTHAVPGTLARAHHGSVSREQRSQIEEDLKSGRLPAVVATSSLELGIDMGAVDLVVQVEAPPSVASGLQRVGRAGHRIGAVSHGVLFPKFRGDLVQTAVAVERMRAGEIEHLRPAANPLDVLAQQLVAMVAMDSWTVADAEALVRRAAPFGGLSRPVLEAVLDMLSGRYPSDEFGELRPRLVWDRATGVLTGRRNAQRLAVTSGGTIPDRGLFGVFLAGAGGPGRRVGELDEEMVYESRVGDVFALGTSSWRIEEITHDRVLVTPAPGVPARVPFWHGDALGRPAELGRAIGRFVAEVAGSPPDRARERVAAAGLDEWATDNLLAYLADQRDATGRVPTDTHLLIERFRDELGDWQIVVHSPYGSRVHAPWALLVAARLRERFGVDVRAMHADDGMVFRLPDSDWDDEPADTIPRSGGRSFDDELVEVLFPEPDDVPGRVTEELGGSALFAARFRECAGRALLLPRRRPDRRQALWQQRQRAAQLLEVAARYPDFPIVLETVRECMNDVFDVPALVGLLQRVQAREIAVTTVHTPRASPFASSLLFGYVAQFLYDADSPLAERRAAALALDPSLLADLLGTSEGLALSDLLDPEALTRTEAESQCLAEGRRARDLDELTDILRTVGPLTTAAVARRCADPAAAAGRLAALADAHRVIGFGADPVRWAAIEDAGRIRDALGVPLPVGVPQVFAEPVADPLGDLLTRYARGHAPFTAAEAAAWLGVGPAVVRDVLRRVASDGRVVSGELRPPGWEPVESDGSVSQAGAGVTQFCDARMLRLLRRRSLAALRDAVEPVAATDFARFLPSWQGIGALRGADGLLRAVEQLAGVPLPASALDTLVLPARVRDYSPAMLDELTAGGEVVWQGRGALAGGDGWVSLHPVELADATLAVPGDVPGEAARDLREALAGGGGHFFRSLSDLLGATDDRALADLLWELVWAGAVTNDTLAPLRVRLGGASTAHRRPPQAPRGRYGRLGRASLPRRAGPPDAAGRWAAVPSPEEDPTVRAATATEVLLDRYGVVTRGSVVAEDVPGGFAGVYRVLAAAEDAGRVRRGYFVEGLGAAQFGAVGAVDRLRAASRPLEADAAGPALVLAACDPANPYGAALPWPERETSERRGHQPGRKAGALVVLVDGRLVLYVERGGRTLLSWDEHGPALSAAAGALAAAVRSGALGRLTVARVDGEDVLGSHHPLTAALAEAGFRLTPRGLVLRG
ncbi:ATP-dependent helicase [Propionicicella superfundia]|uniref:ATP-dependent helicase n=1 Tax=Propionicicella superfundia TaxID=348582 RepID=UPI0004096612|nr:ATP-dependent helicase [Propionicicella superfundia]